MGGRIIPQMNINRVNPCRRSGLVSAPAGVIARDQAGMRALTGLVARSRLPRRHAASV